MRFFETLRLSLFSLGFEMDLKKLPKCPSNIIHCSPCKISTSFFYQGHLFGPQITPKPKLITLQQQWTILDFCGPKPKLSSVNHPLVAIYYQNAIDALSQCLVNILIHPSIFNVKLVVIHIMPLPSSLASRLDNKAFYDKGWGVAEVLWTFLKWLNFVCACLYCFYNLQTVWSMYKLWTVFSAMTSLLSTLTVNTPYLRQICQLYLL